MKKIFLTLTFIFNIFSFSSFANTCKLDWTKIYFQDLVGEKEYNFKTHKKEIQYQTFKEFQGHFPQKVSLNIPFKGDCSNVQFKEVVSHRNIGLRKFPGGDEDHHKHALFPKDTKFESDPFETVIPKVKIDKSKNVVVLDSFKIYGAMTSIDFKKYHPWQIRYQIYYKDSQGIDNKASHTVDLKLTH